jgi:hypothetical protein
MAKKTDNHDPSAKLALRRYFLEKYHADGSAQVLDCCQGGGLLWKELRKTHAVASYWGVDVKPKKGRLKLDSIRILAQPGWPQNVIDIDTYGSPWKHWAAMLPNVSRPLTVFLTIGQAMGKSATIPSYQALESAGLKFPVLSQDHGSYRLGEHVVPISLFSRAIYDVSPLLSKACDYATIAEAIEVEDGRSNQPARYIGVRLEMKTAEPQSLPVARPKRTRTKSKESAHV